MSGKCRMIYELKSNDFLKTDGRNCDALSAGLNYTDNKPVLGEILLY